MHFFSVRVEAKFVRIILATDSMVFIEAGASFPALSIGQLN